MKWDDIEQKANETVVRMFGELLEEKQQTTDLEEEHITRELLMGDALENNRKRREKYDYQKAFKRLVRRRLRIIGGSICAVACMLCIAIGIFLMLADNDSNEQVIQLAEESREAKQVVLQLGNGKKVELGGLESVCIQEMGHKIEVADGKVTYGDNTDSESHEIVYNVLSVPPCAEYQLELADGTKVWLNSDSELKYPVSFSGEVREVFVKGEAYFEVAKDSLHPFVVKSGDVDVRVLGTSFNIRAYQGAPMHTTLISGRVDISHREKSLSLKPGQQCEVAEDKDELVVCEPDLDEVLAWKNGEFIFKNASLAMIMEDIQRYYGIEAEYDQDSLKERKFYLYIERSKRLEEVLQKLTWTGYVKYRLDGMKVILYE